MFRALLLEKDDAGSVSHKIVDLPDESLPEGEVTVAIEWTTLNYKDGLCLSPTGGGLVRRYPHVPGIDFAGTVEASDDVRFKPGDRVILTGWRVGEAHWGGYATKARVKGDWLVPLPEGLTTRQAMLIGTAGFTAAQALNALEAEGLTPKRGPLLITGAAGGVGSVAVALAAAAGYEVVAVTGRPEQEDYLRGLGAARIVPRSALAAPATRALESETWAGCIDAVAGPILARLILQMKYRGVVAAVGLAGGAQVQLSVIPLLLRGVRLIGIDSVLCPLPERLQAWERLARDLPKDKLEAMAHPARLEDLPQLGAAILRGEIRGRVIVDPRA